MEPSDDKTGSSQRMSRLSCVSFLSWIGATILGFISFYLDHFAPYREISGYSKDKIENYLLLLAMLLAFTGIIIAISAVHSLNTSGVLVTVIPSFFAESRSM